MLLIRFLPNCFTELCLSLRYFVYFAQIIRFIKIPTFTRFTSLPIFFFFSKSILIKYLLRINKLNFVFKKYEKMNFNRIVMFLQRVFFLFLMRFTLRYFTLQIILVAEKNVKNFNYFFFNKTYTENLHQYELNSINIWHLYSILAGELNKQKSNKRANVS